MTVSNYSVIDILKISTDYLEKKGIENPRLNVELLLGHILNMNRVQLYLNFERPLITIELDQLRELLKRRANGEPIQYITGETEFYSLKFKVNRYTLIPRPETEILVETVIEQCKKFFDQEKLIEILDIGTGSGNIAIALAKHIERVHITAIDIQDEALGVAKQNADFHEVYQKINFINQDIFTEIKDLTCKYHIIVSNPPYISREEFARLPREVKDYEPFIALNGGKNGLKFYHRIFQVVETLHRENGILCLEISYSKGEVLKEIMQSYHYKEIEVIKDLNRIERVIIGKKINF